MGGNGETTGFEGGVFVWRWSMRCQNGIADVYLADRRDERMYDLLVGHGNHALTVDGDDAMSDANSASFGNSAA